MGILSDINPALGAKKVGDRWPKGQGGAAGTATVPEPEQQDQETLAPFGQ